MSPRDTELEGLLAGTFHASPVAMAMIRQSDSTFVDLNDAFAGVIGLPRGEIVGRSVTELNLWADQAEREDFLEALRERGEVTNYVATFLTRAGEPRIGQFSARILRRGDETYRFTVIHDMTEARTEESTIRRRDAILEAVGVAAERFLGAVDWEDAIGEVLASLGLATGASRVYLFRNGADSDGTLTTTQLFEWCAPGIRPELDNAAMQSLRWVDAGLGRWVDVMGAGGVLHGNVRDFSERERRFLEPQDILSILVVPVFVDEEWWGNIGFDDCVHERAWTSAETDSLRVAAATLAAAIRRRRADVQVREAEQRYRTLVEQLPAVVYTDSFTQSFTAVYTSPRIEDLLGFSAEEWKERGVWRNAVHPEDRKRVLAEDARTNESLEPFRIEYRLIGRDGRIVWVRDEAVVVRDEQGEARFWQGVMFDITEIKRAQEDLERALEIEREATRRLRALDDMKNTFLQAVSHDLRTPLAAVLGSALTLDRADIDLPAEEARDLVRRIASNAKKLSRLVTDLLDLDRLSRGLIEPQRERVDVAALVKRVIDESEVLGGRPITVEAESVTVALDASKVERIVENLLANTARHTPSGTGVWVRVAPESGGVLIVVEDDGPGIPPELRDSIFGAFEQGPTPSAHSPGTGIGLALVARFSELHGGRAWVEERAGGGASFRVFLPDAPSVAA